MRYAVVAMMLSCFLVSETLGQQTTNRLRPNQQTGAAVSGQNSASSGQQPAAGSTAQISDHIISAAPESGMDKGDELEEALAELEATHANNYHTFKGLLDQVPESAKPAIQQAMNNSAQGWQNAQAKRTAAQARMMQRQQRVASNPVNNQQRRGIQQQFGDMDQGEFKQGEFKQAEFAQTEFAQAELGQSEMNNARLQAEQNRVGSGLIGGGDVRNPGNLPGTEQNNGIGNGRINGMSSAEFEARNRQQDELQRMGQGIGQGFQQNARQNARQNVGQNVGQNARQGSGQNTAQGFDQSTVQTQAINRTRQPNNNRQYQQQPARTNGQGSQQPQVQSQNRQRFANPLKLLGNGLGQRNRQPATNENAQLQQATNLNQALPYRQTATQQQHHSQQPLPNTNGQPINIQPNVVPQSNPVNNQPLGQQTQTFSNGQLRR